MKKLYCLLICCLIAGITSVSAQEVQVSNLTVKSDNTITFEVSWGAANRTKPWNNTVWMFIDYWDMGAQQMHRMPITIENVQSSAGSVHMAAGGNNAGFFLNNDTGNDNFSATVSVIPPAGLITAHSRIRPCVYATDYPPVAIYNMADDNAITANLKGTAPFSGQYNNGAAWSSPTGAAVNVSSGQHIASFADATGCPGIVLCGTALSSITLTSGTNTQDQTL